MISHDRDHGDHGSMKNRLDDLSGRLEGISEELTELSVDLLREAVDAGATSRPPLDKTLAQARRSVEKAARLLADAAEADPED